MSNTTAEVVTAKQRALIICGFILALAITGLIMTGGHPRSNWFYPFVIALAVLLSARAFQRGDRPMTLAGDNPPKPIEAALFGAVVAFIIYGAGIYVYFQLLGRDDLFSWAPWVFVSGMTAVNIFRKKRGHDHAIWPSVVLFVVVFALLWIFRKPGMPI